VSTTPIISPTYDLEKRRMIIERLLGGLKDLHAVRVRLSTFDANAGAIQDLAFAAVHVTEFALALHSENAALRRSLAQAIEEMHKEARDRITLELAKMRVNVVSLAEALAEEQHKSANEWTDTNPPKQDDGVVDAEFSEISPGWRANGADA
jgi:hypothetical protein